MKKIIFALLLALLVATPASAITVRKGDTLYGLFGSKWHQIATINGITDPTKLQVGQELKTEEEQMLGVGSLDVIALYEDNLQNSITASDTSLTLVRGTDKTGTNINGTFGFIIDEGTTLEEFIIGTASGTAVTNVQRGISVTDGKTEVVALKKQHRKGATIKMTNYPILGRLNRQLSGLDSLDSFLYYTTSTILPTTNNQLVNKYYVDTVGAGGFTSANVSTTRGLSVDGSSPEKVGMNVSTTLGGAFDSSGKYYQKLQTNGGILTDSNGLYITTTSLNNAGVVSTTASAGLIPMGTASGTISDDWLSYNLQGIGYFGNGSDGNVTINTSSTLTRDMYYDNLTIGNGVELKPNGYKIFVRNTLTYVGTGKIVAYGGAGGNGGNNNGTNYGIGGIAGTQANTAGTLPSSGISGAGGEGGTNDGGAHTPAAGGAGSNTTKAITNASGSAGGAATGSAGAAGTAGTNTGTPVNPFKTYFDVYNLLDLNDTTTVRMAITAGAGSGGGGAFGAGPNYDGGGGGGGGGAPGGIVWVAAFKIVTVNGNYYIDVHGGKGGNGGNSSGQGYPGSGGGGGNGGVAIIIYKIKTGTGTTNILAGAKGVKGTGGSGIGNDGIDGTIGKSYEITL